MKPIRRLALTTALLAAGLELAPSPAQAQPNTYADFPFQQGSLFYQYNPPNRPRRAAARPRYTVPTQPGTYTVQPQAGRDAAPRPGPYAQAQPGYFRDVPEPQRRVATRYYNISPQPGYYYTPPRRGLFGRMFGR